jgi:Ran GTPase-activating protein (RanGAP) involved in mRNA processing and transport
MDYRQKYLKYKKKYLNLQKQNGGRLEYDNYNPNTGSYNIEVRISGTENGVRAILHVPYFSYTDTSNNILYTTFHRENPNGEVVYKAFNDRGELNMDEKYDLLISKIFFNNKLINNISTHKRWENISEIYFLMCKINDNHCENIAIALQKITKLKILNLNSNNIGNGGATLIANALKNFKNKSLTNLQLSTNKIGDKGADALLKALNEYQQINFINLSFNNIGDAGLKQLTQLNKNSLTILKLRHNNIGGKGAIEIGKMLSQNKKLEQLYLDHNKIGDKGAKEIANMLSNQDINLKQLYLNNNKIGDEGAIEFGKMLSQNKKLEQLYLDHNKIGDKGAIEFNKGKGENNTLTFLSLDHNKFNILLIVDNIKFIKNIQTLQLGPSHIGTPGTLKIIELINSLSNLKTIKLYDSNLNDSKFIILDEKKFRINLKSILENLFTDQELHINFSAYAFTAYPYKGLKTRLPKI